jgi:hypothetical protein
VSSSVIVSVIARLQLEHDLLVQKGCSVRAPQVSLINIRLVWDKIRIRDNIRSSA